MAATKKAAGTAARKRKRAPARESKSTQQAKKQMWAVVLFALGILTGALTLVKGQRLWLGLHSLLLGLFGWSAYLLAPLMIYIAVIAAMDKPLSSIRTKLWQAGLLIVIISGALQIFGSGVPDEATLVENIAALYEGGKALKGGGLAGAVVGLPLISLVGKGGACFIIVLLIFVFLMLVTGSTLLSLFRSAAKPVKDLESAYAARLEDAPAKAPAPAGSKARFNIDVDIDGDTEPAEPAMPGHPVHSQAAQEPVEKDKPSSPARQDAPVEYISPEEFPQPEPHAQSAPVEAETERAGRPHPLEEEIRQAQDDTGIDDIVDRFVSGAGSAEKPELKPQSIPLFDEPQPAPSPDAAPPEYAFPPVRLLGQGRAPDSADVSEELKTNAQTLVDTLKSFGVQTRITDICRGPAVTRYELQPSAGVKISKITGLADDIALNLASAGIRIEAPIPNKAAVGIEVPNKHVSVVHIRDIIDSPAFSGAKTSLAVALGKDIAGNLTIADIGKMPHVLIAGATGAGKSVCINSIIISLLYKSSPEEVKLLMVDPKVVELGVYNGIPHLLVPVVTDPKKAAGALSWAVSEMLKRYKTFADHSVRDLAGYNRLATPGSGLAPMPKIVIIIDELADLMMAAPNEVEDSICRLAQMARAAGMHLVIATQRPSVDVITGVIKANIPSRIAFAVSSMVDSRTILDMGGAEKLLGRGDMLFYPVGASKPQRVQGCFVTDAEVEGVVSFIKRDEQAGYDSRIAEDIERHAAADKSSKNDGGGFDEEDDMLPQAIECVVEAGQASTSQLQRKLKLGYARAARIVDQLEERGIVGPFEGSKPRQVLISKERWIEMKLSGAESAQLNLSGSRAGEEAPF